MGLMVEKFGHILRKIRISKQLSQHELAVRLDISRSHVGRLETGEKLPSLAMLFRIAAALGVQASSIIAEMEGRKAEDKP